jgi:hypothetical protein
MNFFAHATLATEHLDSPGCALGAMLPDFVGMLGLAEPERVDDAVRQGMAHHHQVDAAFHYSRSFGGLMGEGVALLKELGVERGRARGASHVGIEILLDGVLALTETARDNYYAALSLGRTQCAGWLWKTTGDANQVDELCGRLSTRAIQPDSWDAERVAWRVARTLSARPRFVLSATDVGHLRTWVSTYRAHVQELTPQLLDEVRGSLNA